MSKYTDHFPHLDPHTALFKVATEALIELRDLEQNDVDLICDMKIQIWKLKREINVLRQYGNKDCTAQADAKLAELTQKDEV